MSELKINILLVDDDDAAHTYHKIMIEEASLDIAQTKSFYGVDNTIKYLKNIIKENKVHDWPHYIFVDLNMPIKSGYDFIDDYQELSAPFDPPKIYFVSSTMNPLDIKRAEKIDIITGFETKFLEIDFFKTLKEEKLSEQKSQLVTT